MVEHGAVMSETGSNRRITDRKKTLKSAKIVINKKQSVIDCFVRDLTSTGAKLQVGDLVAIPRDFTQMLQVGSSHENKLVRAHGSELGVLFLNCPRAASRRLVDALLADHLFIVRARQAV